MSALNTLLNRSPRPHSIQKPFISPSLIRPRARATFRQFSLRSQSYAKPTTIIIAPRLIYATGIAGLGLALTTCRSKVHCDSETPSSPSNLAQPPVSRLSFYELSFGTVTGICAGVFIKKGIKAAAWLLGGVFILVQYLRSTSIIRVDWARMASAFENRFYVVNANGNRTAPTPASVWRRLVDFLTADFQPRASFLAGLTLGLRIG